MGAEFIVPWCRVVIHIERYGTWCWRIYVRICEKSIILKNFTHTLNIYINFPRWSISACSIRKIKINCYRLSISNLYSNTYSYFKWSYSCVRKWIHCTCIVSCTRVWIRYSNRWSTNCRCHWICVIRVGNGKWSSRWSGCYSINFIDGWPIWSYSCLWYYSGAPYTCSRFTDTTNIGFTCTNAICLSRYNCTCW